MNPKTILIADDSAAGREFLRSALVHSGYRVIEAENGKQVLDLARAHAPDLIILDIRMPVLDGLSTVTEIRRDPALLHLPVMALTAFAMQGDREDALKAGFSRYVTKPVRLASLREEVHALLYERSGPNPDS